MESPETPVAPSFFRPHQPFVVGKPNEISQTASGIPVQVIRFRFYPNARISAH